MPSPRDPRRNPRLERLGDALRRAHLGESARLASHEAGAASQDYRAAYQALIDAVFTAPGAAEWLRGLRRAMAARRAAEDEAPRASA
jgi:hypothetical protein